MEARKDAALGLLELPMVEHHADAEEVVTTVLGPYHPDEVMPVSLGRILAEKARARMRDRTPVGLVDARVDHGDDANCEDAQGRQVSGFQAGRRCYRLVLRVVMRET